MAELAVIDDCTPLTEDQRDLQLMVRRFATERVGPCVAKAHADEKYPRELLEEMGDLGLLGGLVPEQYGGQGLDHVTYSIVIEEMARIDHITGVYMSMASSLVGGGLRLFGSEEQKKTWLVPLAQGKIFGATGVTEPGSGSDVAGMTSTYRREGGEFVISGSKAWISNLDHADFLLTFATMDRSLGRKGISAFIIPVGTPGLVFAPYKDKLGFRSITTGDVFLDEVRVPAENLIGEEGAGYAVAMSAVEAGRLSVASRAVGQAYAALQDSLDYSRSRVVFGQAIGDFQLTKAKLADMATGVVTARMLTHAAAALMDSGSRARPQLSMAKQYASDVLQRVATEAVQIHGAYGTSPEYRVSRIYRDAKIFQLVEGANEIHRLLIGDYLLGKRS